MMLTRRYDIEKALMAYFPVFFDLVAGSKLNWGRINKRAEEVLAERKKKIDSHGQPALIEVGFIDLIISTIRGRGQAGLFFLFIKKLFEELAVNLSGDEKLLIKDNLYGFLTNIDLKYLNFLGELCVLNQIKKNTQWRLIDTECPNDPLNKSGPKIDFKFATTRSQMMIEVVNLHLDERLDWTDMRIENLLTQKLPAKLRAKRGVGSPIFYLLPVLWGNHKSISKFVEYYKIKNPVYPNCLVPCCFMSYTYKNINEPIHKFGSIDTILED
ncbi:MAG: hypothetical protein ABL895_15055 [Cyclobacteriaceae bacterium]